MRCGCSSPVLRGSRFSFIIENMPFHKWIISGSQCPIDEVKYAVKNDACDAANDSVVNVIRQLSQLIWIADDVFATIHDDCRVVFDRTERLRDRIKHCQEVVDTLSAKAVPIPQGTLSDDQTTTVPFASCHAQDTCLLSRSSRPPALQRLHLDADGPSPPSLMPHSDQVAADGRPGSASSSTVTHIYCQPFPLDSYCSSISSAETLAENRMSSAVEVPSSVVPIDVSGQPFSRMSTFRRSLIHVDFLIRRRKKKDKRRNTVSEVETKELKEVLQKIAIENQLSNVPMSSGAFQKFQVNHHLNPESSSIKPSTSDTTAEERNNNSINKEPIESQHNGDSKSFIEEDSDSLKLKEKQSMDSITNGSLINRKKKPRSNLPISTSSAAMTVAVKMRQTYNGINREDGHSSSGNWSCSSERTSSDSDQHKSSLADNTSAPISPLSNSEDSLLTDNSKTGVKYYKSGASSTSNHSEKKAATDEIMNKDESEISSYNSSECRKSSIDADGTSTTASVDTDAMFMSSGESDDELSDLSFYQENFGSSTSLSTISNGSLNSLLSRTGTEMSSSTGTLTSICQEPLPTPPPPPKEFAIIPSNANIIPSPSHTQIKQRESSKQKSPRKTSKNVKTSPVRVSKQEQGNSKGIFSSLINKKNQQKTSPEEKLNFKDTLKAKKSNKTDITLQFDMYGNQSPRKAKPVPIFLKENISPVIEKTQINQLQSFCPNNSGTLKKQADLKKPRDNEEINKEKQMSCASPHEKNADLESLDSFSDVSEKSINEEIVSVPLKYGHQITVTPVRRHASIENHKSDVCRRSFIQTPKYDLQDRVETCDNISNNTNVHSKNIVDINEQNAHPSSSTYSMSNIRPRPQSQEVQLPSKPRRPITLIPPHSAKPSARVVLDPDGRVVYSTNSLDRRLGYSSHANNISHLNKQPDWFTKRNQYNYKNYDNSNNPVKAPIITFSSHNAPTNPEKYTYSDSYSQYPAKDVKTSPVVTEFYPSHKILPSRENSVKIVCPVEERQVNATNNTPYTNEKYNFVSISSCNPSPPDPNISGLPQNTSMLTQQNVNLHLEKLNTPPRATSLRGSSSECSYLLSSPSNKDSHGVNGDLITLTQSSLSTEDLFAVIHNYKKRMNIKTDSDHSLPSSSRSSSPSCFRPSSSKGCLAETGFLSPRNSYAHCESSRDRRSWADFRSPPGFSSERKSFASDRLGPSKPTSMHDFKMLLLQTRTSGQLDGQRKSAAELLKVPVSKNNTLGLSTSPMSLSPRNSVSFTTQNSPTTEVHLYNGHSTVPFKRGNRGRASLQPRYLMYPPIFEDCLEEAETHRDSNSEERNKSKNIIKDSDYNRHAKSSIGTSSMWV